MTIVSNILQTTQERLNKVHEAVEKDTAKRKALLDSSSTYSAPQPIPDAKMNEKDDTPEASSSEIQE